MKIKKLLSLILVLSMMLPCIPVGARAEAGDPCSLTADCAGTYDADGVYFDGEND